VIGGFFAWVSRIATGDQHNELLYDIECQVCEQLAARPTDNHDWPKDSTGRRIVDALSKAVGTEKEKPLDHVTLHPEDPIVLLWWGCYDDLTPFQFFVGLEAEFDVRISRDERNSIVFFSEDWWQDERTVSSIVEQCCNLIVPKTQRPTLPKTDLKHRRQFTLKMSLAIMTGLSVALAMIVSGSELLSVYGWLLLPTIVSACLGYMTNGRVGAAIGLFIGWCIGWACVAICVWLQ